MTLRFFRVIVHPGYEDDFKTFFLGTALPGVRSHSGLVSVMIGLPHASAPREFSMVMVWRDLAALRRNMARCRYTPRRSTHAGGNLPLSLRTRERITPRSSVSFAFGSLQAERRDRQDRVERLSTTWIKSLNRVVTVVAFYPGRPLVDGGERTFCMVTIFESLAAIQAAIGEDWCAPVLLGDEATR